MNPEQNGFSFVTGWTWPAADLHRCCEPMEKPTERRIKREARCKNVPKESSWKSKNRPAYWVNDEQTQTRKLKPANLASFWKVIAAKAKEVSCYESDLKKSCYPAVLILSIYRGLADSVKPRSIRKTIILYPRHHSGNQHINWCHWSQCVMDKKWIINCINWGQNINIKILSIRGPSLDRKLN